MSKRRKATASSRSAIRNRRGYTLVMPDEEPAPEVRGCTGKRCYPTMGKARTAASRFTKYKGDEVRMQAYRCSHCGEIHIGHPPGSKALRG